MTTPSARFVWFFCLALASAPLLVAQLPILLAQADGAKPAEEKTLRALIVQLGNADYAIREAAQQRLTGLGEPALQVLEDAARQDADPEIRERARQALVDIHRVLFKQVVSFRGYDLKAYRVVVAPDANWFVTTGEGPLRRGGFEASTPLLKFGSGQHSWSLGMSGDGRRVIVGSNDHIARVYDVADARQIQQLTGHHDEIWGVALSFDGKRAIAGARDCSVRVWDVETGQQQACFSVGRPDLCCLALSADGKTLAVGYKISKVAGTVRLWDLERQKEIRELAGHGAKVSTVLFSQDGKRLVSACHDRIVRIWDVAKGQELQHLVTTGRTESAAFTDDERRLLCVAIDDPTVQLWDLEKGKCLLRSGPVPEGFLGVAAVPGMKKAVTTGRDGFIRVWEWKK